MTVPDRQFISGVVDELGVYNRALAPAEVEAIYGAGAAGKGNAVGNTGSGVLIDAGASGNTVGGSTAAARNVISGNTVAGVYLFAGSGANTVQGNYVGTDAGGTVKIANLHGVIAASTGSTVAGNVISGNTNYGVYLTAGSSANTVAGNRIGTTADGNSALANTEGVRAESGAANNTIGGTTTADRNIVSGNTTVGVHLVGTGTSGNAIQGNSIGTNLAGTAAVPNPFGVLIEGGATNNSVGGTAAGAGNLISGNTNVGVEIAQAGTTGNVVQGNLIGTKADGTTALANGLGVFVTGTAANTIGGTAAGAGNVISGNTGDGVNIGGNGPLPNTVSWWKADGTAADAVGGNNGTLQGGATFGAGVTGAANSAFDLNGTSAYVNVGDPANGSLDFGTGDYTLEFWVNPRAYGGVLLNKGSHGGLPAGSRSGYFVYLNPAGTLLVENSSVDATGKAAQITTNATVPLNAWTHIAVVRACGQRDGVLQRGAQAGMITGGGFVPFNQLGSISTAAPFRIGRGTRASSARWTRSPTPGSTRSPPTTGP